MILAVLNLADEAQQLVRFVIALFQPVLVLALIAGLLIATAHLLTMIGTRWGDRRASSKAMFFSVIVHLLLVMGLVTLIPEYRTNLISNLVDFDRSPIRIAAPLDAESSAESQEQNSGNASGMFRAIPRPDDGAEKEWERTEIPQQATAPVMPVERPKENVVVETPLVPDRPKLPEQVVSTPEQQIPEPLPQLQQADAELKAESLPKMTRPEPALAMPSERSELPEVAPSRTPPPIQRPESPAAAPSPIPLAPEPRRMDLVEQPAPDAELARTPDSAMVETRPAPATSPVAPERIDRTQPPSAGGRMTPDPIPARTQTRMRIPGPATLDVDRPRIRPEIPEVNSVPVTPIEPGLARGGMTLPQPNELPQLSRRSDPFTRPGGMEQVPSVYRLRSDEERDRALIRFGGSQQSEAAVDRSLRWMASVQNPAGFWNAGDYESGAGAAAVRGGIPTREADVGVTALAVLAFLGKLNTVDQGMYSPHVNKALRWIVAGQTTKYWGEGWGSTPGYLGRNATDFEAMYCHAMATFALGEAYAMSRESPQAQWLRQPLEQAVNFILDVQNVDGGWRYIKGLREGDMSIFGWQVMALRSAEAAGIHVDPIRLERMKKFLLERQLGNSGGLAGYRSKEAASAALTAEVLYCRQMLGLANDSRESQEAVQIMLANMPHKSTLNFYYWYYGTLAMHQRGGPEWETWNSTVRDLLISEQVVSGPLAGSWDPRDIWGGYGGRMYSTAIATLSLEVYYRYLPVYRLQEE